MQAAESIPLGDFSHCLEYINTYDQSAEVPVRSPRRPKIMPPPFAGDSSKQQEDNGSPKLYYAFSKEYTVSKNGSGSSSLFSLDSDRETREPLKSADVEQYLDEITTEDEICSVDHVITIVKYHDQWDPKKVAFVATD